jgi:hypothetical protein
MNFDEFLTIASFRIGIPTILFFSDFQLIHMRLEIESLQILFIVDMQVWRNANMKLLQGIYTVVCTVLRCWKLSNSSSAQSNISQAVYTKNSKKAV